MSVSPSGRRILLSQEQPGNRRLFEVAGDGKNPLEIRRLGEDECCFRWTDDEMYLVYQSGGDRAFRYLAASHAIRAIPPRKKADPPSKRTAAVLVSMPKPRRKADFCFRNEAARRTRPLRYGVASISPVPFGNIGNRPVVLARRKMGMAMFPIPIMFCGAAAATEPSRMQLTYSPMDVRFPAISPDGKRASFHAANGGLYLIGMDGGTPEKLDDNGVSATWSPDGNYLYFQNSSSARGGTLIDLRTGKKSAVPSSTQIWAFWLDEDTLIGASEELSKFITFSIKTGKWNDFAPGKPQRTHNGLSDVA